MKYQNAEWILDYDVSITQGDVLLTFPARKAKGIEELSREIHFAVDDLFQSLDRLPQLGAKGT